MMDFFFLLAFMRFPQSWLNSTRQANDFKIFNGVNNIVSQIRTVVCNGHLVSPGIRFCSHISPTDVSKCTISTTRKSLMPISTSVQAEQRS